MIGRVDGAGRPGDEIALREWRTADAQWYVDCSRDPDIQRFTSDPADLTRADVERAIADLHGRTDRDGFVICAAASGDRLGNLALEYEDGVAEVSYWVAPEARGRRVAARALAEMLRWLAEHHPVAELRLWAIAENAASRRAAERVGFERDPDRDQPREVKGRTWDTVAYRLSLPTGRPPATRTGSRRS